MHCPYNVQYRAFTGLGYTDGDFYTHAFCCFESLCLSALETSLFNSTTYQYIKVYVCTTDINKMQMLHAVMKYIVVLVMNQLIDKASKIGYRPYFYNIGNRKIIIASY